MMFSAKEARKKTDIAQSSESAQRVLQAFQRIEQSANKGCSTVIFNHNEWDQPLVKELTEKGFTVAEFASNLIRVSW